MEEAGADECNALPGIDFRLGLFISLLARNGEPSVWRRKAFFFSSSEALDATLDLVGEAVAVEEEAEDLDDFKVRGFAAVVGSLCEPLRLLDLLATMVGGASKEAFDASRRMAAASRRAFTEAFLRATSSSRWRTKASFSSRSFSRRACAAAASISADRARIGEWATPDDERGRRERRRKPGEAEGEGERDEREGARRGVEGAEESGEPSA